MKPLLSGCILVILASWRCPLAAGEVTVAVDGTVVNRLAIGFGWNDGVAGLDSHHPEHSDGNGGHAYTEEEWDRFFDLMAWTGTSLVRHCDWNAQLESEGNDDDDPQVLKDDRLITTDEARDRLAQHECVLGELKERKIDVLFATMRVTTSWNRRPKPEGKPTWREKQHLLPADVPEFIENNAAVARYFVKEKGFDNIVAWSLWNEPNFIHEEIWGMYPALIARMKSEGLALPIHGAEIVHIGPDDLAVDRRMTERYGPLLGAYSSHVYGNVRKQGFPERFDDASVKDYADHVARLRRLCGRKVPVYVGELGMRGPGKAPYGYDDHQGWFEGTVECAAFMNRLMNVGVDGFLKWTWCIRQHERHNLWGALQETDDHLFTPYGPNYYGWAIHGRYLPRGWDVLTTTVTGKDLYVTTGRDPADPARLSLILVNRGREPVDLALVLRLDPAPATLNRIFVSGADIWDIHAGPAVAVDTAGTTVTLPGRSITALTTLDPGDLRAPLERFSVKRGG